MTGKNIYYGILAKGYSQEEIDQVIYLMHQKEHSHPAVFDDITLQKANADQNGQPEDGKILSGRE